MRKVTYSLSLSVDGYVVGPDGSFDWPGTDEEVFALATDEVRGLGVHLLGRRVYEAMRYWETVEPDQLDEPKREFADLWNALPKVVFSTTLATAEGGNTRLATGGLAQEIARLRTEPGESDIGIAGATLAVQAADLGLIDEYRLRIYPVLVGGGIPFFAHHERRVDLELLDSRTFSSKVVHLRYLVRR